MTEPFVHHVHTWGTVIVIDLRAEMLDHSVAQAACAAVTQELEHRACNSGFDLEGRLIGFDVCDHGLWFDLVAFFDSPFDQYA
jgi:hypothetical protein